MQALSEKSYLRIWQIIGDKRRGIPAIIPISRASWWSGVKSGKYPKSHKLSSRVTAWKAADVSRLLEKFDKK